MIISPLLIRPLLFSDESLERYIFRLGKENFFDLDNVGLFYSSIEKGFKSYFNGYELNSLEKNLFSYLKLLTLHEVEVNYIKAPENYYINKYRRTNHARFCPMCLKEKQYHRFIGSVNNFV